MRLPRWIGPAVAVMLVIGAIGGALVGWSGYRERYAVTTEAPGEQAVARVVAATMREAGDLRVSRLTGTVQGVGVDTRGLGMLQSRRVMKAPFEVDYFVDLARLRPRDLYWDADRGVLRVDAPDLVVGRPNVDEARTYLDRTDGLFVTRGAMQAMQRQASAGAARVAEREARSPANLARAKAHARTAVARLFAAPLAAAGVRARVDVRFPDDPVRDEERWDVSRSIEAVLANRP